MKLTAIAVWVAVAVSASLSAGAAAQDTNPLLHQIIRYDDGTAAFAWKVNDPTTASDYFNVDFGTAINGKAITAILAEGWENLGKNGSLELGIYENQVLGVPNLASPLVTRAGEVPAADGFDNDTYSVACVAAGTPALGYSATCTFPAGDSHTWLGADSSTSSTNSYFTSTSYSANTSVPFTRAHWTLGIGLHPGVTLMVNGQPSATVRQDGGEACFVFYGPTFRTPGVLFLLSPIILSLLPITTDTFAPGPCPNSWALCNTFTCADTANISLTFGHFYFDATDLKPNGRPKVKLATATLDVEPGATCTPSFGQKDDCQLESIWVIQNPTGPSDWFNVNHGTIDGSPVNRITGLELCSWDFCGSGPSWAEVGVYRANIPLDPSGCTPGIAVSKLTNAYMPAGTADWGCPATFYDLPDITAQPGTVYHAACTWQPNESCVWLGGDNDGIDSTLGTPIPNNGCSSLFSVDGYSSPAVRFTAANWMMQITWD